MEKSDKIYFAQTDFRNKRQKFGIKEEDRRKHIYIIGKTGMGKSTLLENMAIQDIAAGNGLGIIDPHGELAEKLLNYIPKERLKDVVYFNPADTEFPVAFNVLEKVSDDQRHLVAAGLMGVFKKIWPDVWSARMEYILNNTVLALLEYPNSTLLGINRMLSDKDYRKEVVSKIKDEVVKAFWTQEFAKYTERFAQEATPAIQNKIGQFITNPLIRNIIGQEHTSFDMRKMMDEKKILIVNLSKGRVGESNSHLLGAMLITKLYLAAMSRVDIPEEERADFHLYVDEFQNFATDAFADILSEARKYRLSLALAHQYIGQLVTDTSTKVRDAVFGNVGTMIVFRIGAADAEFLEKEFEPEFMIQDLVNLPFAGIYLKLMIDGVTSLPFSAQTLAPMERPAISFKKEIIEFSREKYGTPSSQVREKIAAWHAIMENSNKISSGMPPSISVPFEPPKPKYEAICSVCGKKIFVPFKPDGRRPVYCQEHMGMPAPRPSSSREKAAIEPHSILAPFKKIEPIINKPKFPRIKEGELVIKKREEKQEEKKMSLKDLLPKHPPARKSPDLTELRRTLEKSLISDAGGNEELKSKKKILKPGDTIKF
ncbi:MAG: type IV secretion system DNA-binding domain-containing protein [Candidatus Niyogibacteria bacterium]|nr:type IV secretion system DNA-binding domain-containing protein [Candidatus Niyogibacteria bacterium]